MKEDTRVMYYPKYDLTKSKVNTGNKTVMKPLVKMAKDKSEQQKKVEFNLKEKKEIEELRLKAAEEKLKVEEEAIKKKREEKRMDKGAGIVGFTKLTDS
jgi:hypothetical protein